jgi:hypothetical protein
MTLHPRAWSIAHAVTPKIPAPKITTTSPETAPEARITALAVAVEQFANDPTASLKHSGTSRIVVPFRNTMCVANPPDSGSSADTLM